MGNSVSIVSIVSGKDAEANSRDMGSGEAAQEKKNTQKTQPDIRRDTDFFMVYFFTETGFRSIRFSQGERI
ncbi:MAG: hypothetical protein LBK44_01515 [Spirochaetales bacterium]|nr:hypothetical protein [Spirochaetales bacterium]